jgi:hypothetical protein
MADTHSQTISEEWVSFPGGELEGKRPRTHPTHLTDPAHPAHSIGTFCFQCFRAGLDRERAIRAAGELDTASEQRFQFGLPFEPVDEVRLSLLKAERASARSDLRRIDRFADRRRQAQLSARRALQAVLAGVKTRQLSASIAESRFISAVHAAELQLPESWLPFVVSR